MYVYSMYLSVFNSPYIYNPSYIWVYPNYILEYVEFHFEAIAWFSYTLSVLEKMEFSSFKVRFSRDMKLCICPYSSSLHLSFQRIPHKYDIWSRTCGEELFTCI